MASGSVQPAEIDHVQREEQQDETDDDVERDHGNLPNLKVGA
jgi:hypothetical protein